MTVSPLAAPARGTNDGAVRHFCRAVGETADMHRVSDRAERRARAPREWAL
jgi:hypothetical protein